MLRVISGYCGGVTPDPNYQQVCAGDSGHAEVVEIEFDPERIGFDELLEVFFAIHDPTTRDRQGGDVGHQYRSAIFAHDAEQARMADEVINRLETSGVYADRIVTEVRPAVRFYPAEAYHQKYFENNPQQGYCQWIIAPKVAKFVKQYAGRIRPCE